MRSTSLKLPILALLSLLVCSSSRPQQAPRLEVRTANDQAIVGLTWSPDSNFMLSFDALGTTVLWDAKGEQLKSFHDDDTLIDVAIAADDRTIVFLKTGETSSTVIFRDAAGKLPDLHQTFPRAGFQAVGVSPTASYLILGSESCTVWDVRTKRVARTIRGCNAGAFSPDEKHLLTASVADDGKTATISSWPIGSATVPEWTSQGIPSGFTPKLVYSPDGTSVLVGDLGSASYTEIDTGSGRPRETVRLGHGTPAFALPHDFGPFFKFAPSPDRRVVAANLDQTTGGTNGAFDNTIQLLDLDSGALITKLQRGPRIAELARIAGDKLLIVDLLGDGYLWDTASGIEIERFTRKNQSDDTADDQNTDTGQSALPAAAISQSGRYVAIAPYGVFGSGATVWDTETGAELVTVNGDFFLKEENEFFGPDSMEFVGDGTKLLIRGCEPASEMLLDMPTLNFVWFRKLPAGCGGMAQERSDREMTRSAKNGALVLEGKYADDSSALLDGATGKALSIFKGLSAMPVGLTPDGKTAVLSRFVRAGDRMTVTTNETLFLDTATRSVRARIPFAASSIAIAPDGKAAALVTTDRLLLSDTSAGREIARTTTGAQVNDVAFSADGRFVLAATSDGSTRIFDASAKLAEVCRLFSLRDGNWVVLTPDGRFDTNSIESIRGLVWIAPDDPLRALPLEIFSRQYFEPGLLRRLLKCMRDRTCDKEFKKIPSVAAINRVQPRTGISSHATRGRMP